MAIDSSRAAKRNPPYSNKCSAAYARTRHIARGLEREFHGRLIISKIAALFISRVDIVMQVEVSTAASSVPRPARAAPREAGQAN
jgi:hypothetical protein